MQETVFVTCNIHRRQHSPRSAGMETKFEFKWWQRATRNLQLLLLACIILVLVAVVVVLLLLVFSFLLALWHLYLLDGCIWVHAKLLGHQPVHTVHERRRVRDIVTRLQQSSLEEHLGGIQSRLVVLVGLDLAQEVGNHGVIGVDFKSLSTRHLANLVLVLPM